MSLPSQASRWLTRGSGAPAANPPPGRFGPGRASHTGLPQPTMLSAQDCAASRSSPSTSTWPSLRPGRGALP
ncbi:MAG: hypothetical protein OZX49_00526 [Immundisolibacter sp.]|nr:hypothetical protein [Immundisolibacter sp.]